MRRPAPGERDGWGGRDRTYECRNQNPVPYHLATPQRSKPTAARGRPRTGPGQGTRSDVHANAARGWRASVRATKPRAPGAAPTRSASAAAGLRLRTANHANTQPPDPVIRAVGDRCAEHCERRGDVRKSCNGDRLQVIPAITLGKDVHFRRRRRRVSIPAPRRSPPSAPRPAARCTHGPQRRQRHRGQPLADAARERRRAEQEERHVGAQREADAHQRLARQAEPHRRLSASSTRRRVGAAAAQAAALRDPLGRRRCRRRSRSRSPAAARAPRAPRGRPRPGRRAGRSCARSAPSSRRASVDRVAVVERDEQRFERVVAVGAPSRDVQEEVELRRRRDTSRCAHQAIDRSPRGFRDRDRRPAGATAAARPRRR